MRITVRTPIALAFRRLPLLMLTLFSPVLAGQRPSPPGGRGPILDGTNAKTLAKSIEQAHKTLSPTDRKRFDESMALARRLFPEPGVFRRRMHNTTIQNVVQLASRMRKELDKNHDGSISNTELKAAMVEMRTARLQANESAAIATLMNCMSAQMHAQASGVIDANNNGIGEFGFFGELNGTVGARTEANTPGEAFLSPPVLSRHFVVRKGLVERSGYLFQVWLPAADGRAVAEGRTGGIGPVAPDPGNSEKVFAIYAWPIQRGVTGNRAFVATQDGDVFATANVKQRYSGRLAAPGPYAVFPKDVTTLGYLPRELPPSNDQGAWKAVR